MRELPCQRIEVRLVTTHDHMVKNSAHSVVRDEACAPSYHTTEESMISDS